MLAVGLAAYTGKAIAVNHTLKTATLGGANYVNIGDSFGIHDVFESYGVAKCKFLLKIERELDKLALRRNPCLFEMPLKRRAGVLFCGFVIGKLYSGVTVFFYCTELRNNARTSLDNSAWHVLTLGTENGSHSDFFSN